MDLVNPTVEAARENRAFWFGSAEEVVSAYPALAADYAQTEFEAMAVVPLAFGEAAGGVIALNFHERRSFREDERRLLLALASQCAQAIDRARLYTQVEGRANAASVLAHVADGVFQLDRDRRVA